MVYVKGSPKNVIMSSFTSLVPDRSEFLSSFCVLNISVISCFVHFYSGNEYGFKPFQHIINCSISSQLTSVFFLLINQ